MDGYVVRRPTYDDKRERDRVGEKRVRMLMWRALRWLFDLYTMFFRVFEPQDYWNCVEHLRLPVFKCCLSA